jgi:hypothetical protein
MVKGRVGMKEVHGRAWSQQTIASGSPTAVAHIALIVVRRRGSFLGK